jgi:hypothetical protein
LGVTVALPVNRHTSIKLYGSTGVSTSSNDAVVQFSAIIVLARQKYTAFFYSVSQVHGIIFACQTDVSRHLPIVSHVVEQADEQPTYGVIIHIKPHDDRLIRAISCAVSNFGLGWYL